MTYNTQKILAKFTSHIDINKKYMRNDLGKILTIVYHEVLKSELFSKKKNETLNYSDFGSEFNIESLSEPVKKTLSKFESDDAKEHWRIYGDWVSMNKDSFKDREHRFEKGKCHEKHLSKQRDEFEVYENTQKGKDTKDTETGVNIEQKNITKTKNKITFTLWNLQTSKNETLNEVLDRKIKDKEYADIYLFSDEDITVIIPSELFIHNEEYYKVNRDSINISIPFSKCKPIWIRDFTKEIDKTQKIINIKELRDKYLDDIGPKI